LMFWFLFPFLFLFRIVAGRGLFIGFTASAHFLKI
jgi:hypothetical protein